MNIEKQQLWSTTIFNYKLENLDNESIKSEILEKEKQGKGFHFWLIHYLSFLVYN